MATAVGIDFGTNNSEIVALPPDGHPMIVKSLEGDDKIPSVIYYPHTAGEQILVGKSALAMLPDENVILQPKRTIGLSVFAMKQKGFEKIFNAKIAEVDPVPSTLKGVALKRAEKEKKEREKAESSKFVIEQDGAKVVVTIQTVIQDFFTYFRTLTEAAHGKEVKYVVSNPQYFGPTQKEVFREGVQGAIKVEDLLEFVTEPLAAQFAYQARTQREPNMKRLLVLDVGAGTTDISFIQEKNTPTGTNYQGLCTGGNDYLGGCDQDRYFLSALETEMKADPSFKKENFDERNTELLIKVQELKHKISLVPSGKIIIHGATTNPFTFTVDKQKKLKILHPFYTMVATAINDCFERKAKAAKKTGAAIKDTVQVCYLVGGPTRDSDLCDVFQQLFPNAVIIGKPGTPGSLNPDEVVAYGCSFWAAAKLKTTPKIGLPANPKHRPCLSKSIGVETVTPAQDGTLISRYNPILLANTGLPAAGGESNFGTYKNDQDSVVIKVFTGEGEFTASDGIEKIGEFSIPLQLPNKMDEVLIDIEMEVTRENVLLVRAGPPDKIEEREFKNFLN